MQLSLAGAWVCLGLFLLGLIFRAPRIVPLFGCMAFGATAIVNLTSLGGSSPLIGTVFVLVILMTVIARKTILMDLGRVFALYRASWTVLALILYGCLSAIILPRFFEGQTSAFIASRVREGRVLEVPLAPSGGNLTQTGYFVAGALMYFAFAVILLERKSLFRVRLGYITWAALQAALGLVDFAAKAAGAGDVLAPIRTANYSMLTNVEQSGFARVVGGFPEASSFGAATMACLAFTFSDWRATNSRMSGALSIVLLFLLIMSTSTTAYIGLVVMAVPVVAALLVSVLRGRMSGGDLTLIVVGLLSIIAIFGIYLYDSRILAPYIDLYEATILNKAATASALERGYWNERSFQSFIDTGFLGIGLGSSRASSWIIAVLSQLGLIGTACIAILVFELGRSIRPATHILDKQAVALQQAARASGFAGLTVSAVSGAGADPGMQFFMALAVCLACRRYVGSSSAAEGRPSLSVPAGAYRFASTDIFLGGHQTSGLK